MAGFNGTSFHEVECVKDKLCVVCSTSFKPFSGVHKFCSNTCKGKWKYITGEASTERQYEKISNNWKRYLRRLLYSSGRKRNGLTIDILLTILKKQNYRCALSGTELTCKLEKGTRCLTNASVDRIIPGGAYSIDNIQLVCRALNSWRADLPINEFVNWCGRVVEYQTKEIEREEMVERKRDYRS